MKKAINLALGVLITGAAFSQETKDTVPTVTTATTQPTLRGDTTPLQKRDTVSWSKTDSTKKWSDSLKTAQNAVADTNAQGAAGTQTPTIKDPSVTGENKTTAIDTTPVVADQKKIDDQRKVTDTLGATGVAANADQKEPTQADDQQAAKLKKKVKDRVMMKEGEMVIIKDGKESKMTKSVKLPDGNIVMADGTVKMPGGNSVKLKDGEYISLKPGKGK